MRCASARHAVGVAHQYDVEMARTFDNGVFWIDYESLLHNFRMILFSWNPELFRCARAHGPARIPPVCLL